MSPLVLPTRYSRARLYYPYPLGVGGGPSLPNADYGPDVRAWLRLNPADAPTDGWRMPSRDPGDDYYWGDLGDVRGSAYEHPFNNALQYKGWNLLQPHEPGGVTVDSSNTAGGSSINDFTKGGALNAGGGYSDQLGVGNFRWLLDGLILKNGAIRLTGGGYVYLWNVKGSFPPGQLDGSTPGSWKAQFNAACVRMGVPVVGLVPDTAPYQAVRDSVYMKYNYQPTAIRLQQAGTPGSPGNGTQAHHIGVWNSDFHDFGDDGIFLGASNDVTIVGTRLWNINNDLITYPGQGPYNWFHDDAVQFVGRETRITITDSHIGQKFEIVAEVGNIDYLTIARVLVANAGTVTASLGGLNGHVVGPHGSVTIKWFSASIQHAGDPDYNMLVGANPHGIGEFYSDLDGPATLSRSFTYQVPSGIAGQLDSYGRITNLAPVLAHIDDPANMWRAANTDRDTVLAGLLI